MRFLKALVWTGLAMCAGVFIATYQLNGRTTLEHVERTWKKQLTPARIESLKTGVHDAYEGAKKTLSSTSEPPSEHHSSGDRDEVNRLIAKRAQASK